MDWLFRLFDKLFSIFPRLQIIGPNEAGIRITLGKRVQSIGPGWYIYLPLIQDINWLEVVDQVIDIRPQSVTTSDGSVIIVSGAIQYKITNASKALLSLQDFDTAIQTLAIGTISRYVSKRTYDDCRNVSDIEVELLKAMRETISGYGVKLMKAFITDFCKAQTIRIIGRPKIIPVLESGE